MIIQLHGIAGRIGRGITGNTKPKIKKIDFSNKETAKEAAQIINDASKTAEL